MSLVEHALGAALAPVGVVIARLRGLAAQCSAPVEFLRPLARFALPSPPSPAAHPAPAHQGESRTPAVILGSQPDHGLPRAYGFDRVLLLARDPWSLFVCWEVTPTTRADVRARVGTDAEGAADVLRVSSADCPEALDAEVSASSDWAHIQVGAPGTTWCAAVGLRTTGRRFVPYVRSSPVATPPAQPSSDTSVRWVSVAREPDSRLRT